MPRLALVALLFSLCACGGPHALEGEASWYGPGLHGNKTASGERFNMNAMTAAHRTLPFGSRVRVTYPKTGRAVIVRINDRGPYGGGRIIDLSKAAAKRLGLIKAGVGEVELEVLSTPRGK
ncbi:septal ring lytic transglycosylase RlpA family protein [Myxococcota bacterium]|nr:septal ring lytic transglycosylase RlpA family protein [Myxococcota bacterium]MBU1430188.1 septal ring lytic transglycosylase RlpA family protein [Myxococcota bacterium]MBU1897066.1 septal ring lytic transglycosylase RlpA family protein [Myxococcota bacterium]